MLGKAAAFFANRKTMQNGSRARRSLSAETLLGLLKAEIGTTVRESREAARIDIFRFIEAEYRVQPHPSVQGPEYGCVAPLETRALVRRDPAAGPAV
ncbi:hypothetical protein ACH4ZX_16680 [Streptomyces sp. NPDC020490]|uniref:hypothetical protein n=1 Tax=Streptomyces sp. NPDC020490 TaxID=3365078 RepID=UPI0037A9A889